MIQRSKDSPALVIFVSQFCYMLACLNIVWLVQVIMIPLLFLHSDGYVKWNVIREITQAFILVVVRRNLKLVWKTLTLPS